MGKKWWLVHARTITKHGLKYRNESYNESIYMETKYIFAKESSFSNMFNSILWYMYFVKIPNETINF